MADFDPFDPALIRRAMGLSPTARLPRQPGASGLSGISLSPMPPAFKPMDRPRSFIPATALPETPAPPPGPAPRRVELPPLAPRGTPATGPFTLPGPSGPPVPLGIGGPPSRLGIGASPAPLQLGYEPPRPPIPLGPPTAPPPPPQGALPPARAVGQLPPPGPVREAIPMPGPTVAKTRFPASAEHVGFGMPPVKPRPLMGDFEDVLPLLREPATEYVSPKMPTAPAPPRNDFGLTPRNVPHPTVAGRPVLAETLGQYNIGVPGPRPGPAVNPFAPPPPPEVPAAPAAPTVPTAPAAAEAPLIPPPPGPAAAQAAPKATPTTGTAQAEAAAAEAPSAAAEASAAGVGPSAALRPTLRARAVQGLKALGPLAAFETAAAAVNNPEAVNHYAHNPGDLPRDALGSIGQVIANVTPQNFGRGLSRLARGEGWDEAAGMVASPVTSAFNAGKAMGNTIHNYIQDPRGQLAAFGRGAERLLGTAPSAPPLPAAPTAPAPAPVEGSIADEIRANGATPAEVAQRLGVKPGDLAVMDGRGVSPDVLGDVRGIPDRARPVFQPGTEGKPQAVAELTSAPAGLREAFVQKHAGGEPFLPPGALGPFGPASPTNDHVTTVYRGGMLPQVLHSAPAMPINGDVALGALQRGVEDAIRMRRPDMLAMAAGQLNDYRLGQAQAANQLAQANARGDTARMMSDPTMRATALAMNGMPLGEIQALDRYAPVGNQALGPVNADTLPRYLARYPSLQAALSRPPSGALPSLPDVVASLRATGVEGIDNPESEPGQVVRQGIMSLYGPQLAGELMVPPGPDEFAPLGRLGGGPTPWLNEHVIGPMLGLNVFAGNGSPGGFNWRADAQRRAEAAAFWDKLMQRRQAPG